MYFIIFDNLFVSYIVLFHFYASNDTEHKICDCLIMWNYFLNPLHFKLIVITFLVMFK